MRYFKLTTHLTVPRSLSPGAGNTHERPVPGDVIACTDESCARESRFVNGRVRAGDMIETTETEYLAAENVAALEPPVELATTAPVAKTAKGK